METPSPNSLRTAQNIVMVVDDDPADREHAERQLLKSDRVDEVLTSSDGDRALELIRERDQAGLPLPDVIFLDLRMPQMSGFEFLEAFEERYEESATRIVVVTGAALEPEKNQALAHRSVVDCIPKPVFLRDFERLFRPKASAGTDTHARLPASQNS